MNSWPIDIMWEVQIIIKTPQSDDVPEEIENVFI